jgi:iron complex outermembrane receptor protein
VNRHPRFYFIRSLLLALGMAPVVTTRTPSQAPAATARIIGRLVDQQTRAPVQGARVTLLGTRFQTGTDSAGEFTQAGLTAGAYFLEIRALGYGAGSWLVRLGDGETIDTIFELYPLGYELDPVVVTARPTLAQRRLEEFERRSRERHGVFITAEQIETNNATTLMDVLRNVPGVRIMCTTRGCQVRMTRSARGGGGGCQPDWVMDGLPATFSSTPSMSTVGIVGIEIYRSLSETPSEFLKSDSQCGVIAIWTKSGP